VPYINQSKRDVLDAAIDNLQKVLVDLELDNDNNNMEGNLNYTITRLLRMCYGKSYGEINDAIGMLQCVMLEHYRTIAVPYENQKKFENGDVEVSLVSEYLDEIVIETPCTIGEDK
jgi:hypothetical protein